MDTFDEQLAKSAAVIIPLRRLMIEKTNQIAAQTYNEISGREMENFQLRYMCCLKNDDRIEEQFLSTLKKNRDEDVFRGTTSFGIHREDIQTLLNEKEMKLFASQGQIRTAALSMKLAHIDLFHELTGEDPVLLLDDVMSELDMGRRKRLLKKKLNEQGLEFQPLVECSAHVYMLKGHPLAGEKSLSMERLKDYPCISFEQEEEEFYYAEEILSENAYPQMVRVNDRSTMLNLMEGLNGYTLCSGVIFGDLNGGDYVLIPFSSDDGPKNSRMTIGYITKKNVVLSHVGEKYIEELKRILPKDVAA
jgi:hypothetical protein